MSDYTPITDFSAKDSLTMGDPEKLILGADVDAEYNSISTAIGTKYDSGDLSSQAGAEAGSNNTTLMTPLRVNQALVAGNFELPDVTLSSNVPLLNAANPFTAAQSVTAADNANTLQAIATGGRVYLQGYNSGLATPGARVVGINAGGGGTGPLTVDATILSLIGTTSVLVNGVNATDFARLSQENAFSRSEAGISSQTFTNTSNSASAFSLIGVSNDVNNALQLFVKSSTGSPANQGVVQMNDGPLLVQSVSGTVSVIGSAITLNSVNTTDFARLSQANTFTGNTLVSKAAAQVGLASTTASSALITLSTNGSSRGFIGADGGGSVISGAGTGDLVIRVEAGGLLFSGNAGTTIHLGLSSAGVVTTPNASAAEVGYKGLPQNSQSVDYTGVLTDAGKNLHQTGASKTFTIPANGSVAYPVGTVLNFTCDNATGVSVAITTDTLRLGGTSTTGTRTLSQYGMATALKILSTTWIITGVGLA